MTRWILIEFFFSAVTSGAFQGKDEKLASPDWIILGSYALLMIGIGFFYSKKNKNAEDYHLGKRSMNPVLVGLSLFATILSTLSYLSYPGEMIRYGPVIFTSLAGVINPSFI